MSVFGIFISPTEHKFKELMNNKPEKVYFTTKKNIGNGFQLPMIENEVLKRKVTICLSNEKKSMLNLFDPFFSFEFDKNEYGVIILGDNHNLLKLEKEVAYLYIISSKDFMPIVDIKGNYDDEWYTNDNVELNSNYEFKKITLNDILLKGVQVFWIDKMETLKTIDEEMNTMEVKSGLEKLQYLIDQTNWRSDKVIYMNKYKNINQIIINDSEYKFINNNSVEKHKKDDDKKDDKEVEKQKTDKRMDRIKEMKEKGKKERMKANKEKGKSKTENKGKPISKVSHKNINQKKWNS